MAKEELATYLSGTTLSDTKSLGKVDMNISASESSDTGLEVIDIQDDAAYANRRIHARDLAKQDEGMEHIAHAFIEDPETVLQKLVNAAVELCDADSAGISIEKEDSSNEAFYHWVATAGQYSEFFDTILPRYPSACGICLERGRPQLFRVGQRFFDIMGIQAPLVTDGLLLPWEVAGTRGTIFIMAHGRTEAFDQNDCRIMQMLANFAATGVRLQKQQKMLLAQANAAGAAAMANNLAHRINNPLQSLTNILYLAAEDHDGVDAKGLAQQALSDLADLSALVKQLLDLSYTKI
jgi:two-component sensor histidine kinase